MSPSGAVAKSPRIVPGAASPGLVAPIISRHDLITPGPDIIPITAGPLIMNSAMLGKKGLSTN